MEYSRHGDVHRAIRPHPAAPTSRPSDALITYGAEVLLVLADSLHLWSVQYRHIVGHGLLRFLLVLFLEAQTVGI